jgi:hypothetical protein
MNLTKIFHSIVLITITITVGWVTRALPISSSFPVTGSPSTSAQNYPAGISNSSDLTHFISSVENGNTQQLVGIYVPDLLALPVVQQPASNPAYVSTKTNTVTQFGMPSKYGTTAILAHNNLSGSLFYSLKTGDLVVLVYGDGSLKYEQIDHVRRFQALSPESPFSNFIDLEKPERQLTSTDLFSQIYNGGNALVFQTCLAAHGNPSWGRIFITAKPYVAIQPVAIQPFQQLGQYLRKMIAF